jgi:hypothetical protein
MHKILKLEKQMFPPKDTGVDKRSRCSLKIDFPAYNEQLLRLPLSHIATAFRDTERDGQMDGYCELDKLSQNNVTASFVRSSVMYVML